MTRGRRTRPSRLALIASLGVLALLGAGLTAPTAADEPGRAPTGSAARGSATAGLVSSSLPALPTTVLGNAVGTARQAPALPGGGRKVFGRKRFLVAYYGTAGTAALGVLGEGTPDAMHRRLVRAGKPFKRKGERVQPVYELIVTVADAVPGPDGDYNHDVLHSRVQEYIDAAQRNKALLVLDIQPGRSDFLTVAKRWEWALKHPWVGLALDPEWRMGPDQVPGQVIGSVRAKEVNEVSAWLDALTAAEGLPEKVFMIHQFRSSMVSRANKVKDRPRLAEVQHVDGFGTPSQKLATYGALARPRQFTMGFKLFYDEDVPRMRAGAVRRIRPAVRFVSFQ
ncbi:hypothetical protein [Nocardioides campestrisoli]|uniref:hypothetical protein n=1 Tax=Nocardioides campestrisoli TaxID=2736757 RepID=UPI00163D42BD|nr:hypothetical protein [Nocardioides campestrisoli]